ncbi:MAG TPA: hypothetical protein VGP61_02305 [Gemmatimonadales bacterium]|jgi:hypothetical protein|nr:hypothetical protein [Gemmatimonadales bacterium]
MLSQYRLLTLCALLGGAAASSAQSQTPEPRPRLAPGRIMRVPPLRFGYRMPRLRLDAGELRFRALDRSFNRMDRQRERQFALQQRLREREFARRDLALRRHLERPFLWRRRFRTI